MIHHDVLRKHGNQGVLPPDFLTTLDPSAKGTNVALSNGNLTATKISSTGWQHVRATQSRNLADGGKFYIELTYNDERTADDGHSWGAVDDISISLNGRHDNVNSSGFGYQRVGTNVRRNNLSISANLLMSDVNGVPFISEDRTIGLLFDFDAQEATYSANGNLVFDNITLPQPLGVNFNSPIFPAFSVYNIGSWTTVNFGEAPFSFRPNGYRAWNGNT